MQYVPRRSKVLAVQEGHAVAHCPIGGFHSVAGMLSALGKPQQSYAMSNNTTRIHAFMDRLLASRAPFPDLKFEIGETIAAGDRVALSWTTRGTQLGPMGGRPPSGRSFAVQGMTIYHFADGRIIGHRQVVDRLSVAQQLGLLG